MLSLLILLYKSALGLFKQASTQLETILCTPDQLLRVEFLRPVAMKMKLLAFIAVLLVQAAIAVSGMVFAIQ